jgi:hypothetical protein
VADAIYFSKDKNFANSFVGKAPDPAIAKEAEKMGWVGPNVMPVYLKAENPFDYENLEHVKKVFNLIKPKGDEYLDKPTRDLSSGDWAVIELKSVQEAIKKAGFDSFYVKENNTKNLGVFDPKQIKSAIGNKGTFNPNDPSIVRGAVAAPAGTAAMQDEEKK